MQGNARHYQGEILSNPFSRFTCERNRRLATTHGTNTATQGRLCLNQHHSTSAHAQGVAAQLTTARDRFARLPEGPLSLLALRSQQHIPNCCHHSCLFINSLSTAATLLAPAPASAAAAAAKMANTTGKKRKLDDWEPKQVRPMIKGSYTFLLVPLYGTLLPGI